MVKNLLAMWETWVQSLGQEDPTVINLCCAVLSCSIVSDTMNCILPGSSVHGDAPGKNTGVGCHSRLWGIFPVLGSNPGLPHCKQILYHLSYQGSPKLLECIAYSFPRGIFLTQELNQGLLHCRWILYQVCRQESPFHSL